MKIASLEKVAKELNAVMAYGQNDKGEIEDESELIDLELSEKALAKEIAKRAKEDLAPRDKDDFSADVWAYFAQNGLLPEGCEEDSDQGKDEDASEADTDSDGEDSDEAEGEEEAPKAKKEKVKKEKKEKKAEKEKKAPRPKGPSFEDIACDIVKSNKPEKCREALLEKFTELYAERGKTDEAFIAARVEIYYRIAAKRLNFEYTPLAPKQREKVKKEKVKKERKPDADGMDEEEEAPKPKKSKK